MLLVLAVVPLPGIQQLAGLTQLGRASGWWAAQFGGWPPSFSPLSTGLLGLVLARFALDLVLPPAASASTRKLWSAVAQGLYLGASFAGGIAMGLAMDERFPDLVLLDGPILGVLLGAVMLVTGAALWSMAGLVRRSGIASGALLLFGVWEAVRAARFTVELILASQAGEPDLGWLAVHTGAVPLSLTMVALWRWTPSDLPVHLGRSLVIRGPLDILILPLVVGALVGTLASDLAGYPVWTPQPPLYDPGLLARTVAALLVVPTLGWWMRRQPGAPGSPIWVVAASLTALTSGLLWLIVWWNAS